MPELPEVETVVRGLREHVVGSTVQRVRFATPRISGMNPRNWKRLLADRTIQLVDRRGKFIVLHFNGGYSVVAHLRMTGRLLIVRDEPRDQRDRLIILLRDGRELRFRDLRTFGTFEVLPSEAVDRHAGIARLGPDALTVGRRELVSIFSPSQRPIKSALLDQTRIAGLGNIYADETLHRARVHPLRLASQLSAAEFQMIRNSMRRVLRQAIKHCGTTFDTFSDIGGRSGGFGPRLCAYGREGLPCYGCRRPIARIKIVGRSSFFCPSCQRNDGNSG